MTVAVPEPATVTAAVDAVLVPLPATGPLAPAASALSWTVAAAARRQTDGTPAAPPAAAATTGQQLISGAAAATAAVTRIFSTEGAFAALKSDGSVVTWGGSGYGGDSSAVASKLTSGVTQVYSTYDAFAAVKSDGSVVTWGTRGSGGDSSAVAARLTSGVKTVSATSNAFAAIKSDGSVVTWGNTTYGGDSSAVASKLTSGVTQVYSTASAFAAVKSDGSVVTWGSNSFGGDSSAVASKLTSGVTKVYSNANSFAAVKSDGSVVSWGFYTPDPKTASRLTSGVTQVYSTAGAFAAVKSDGSVVTWGSSGSGPDSAVTSKLTSGVTKVYSNVSAFAAVKSDGSVVTWGNSVSGGDSSAVASKLTSGVTQVYSTDYAFAAVKSDGSVVTWGKADSFSDGGGDSSAVAARLTSGVKTVSATSNAFAAVKSDGSVVTWGNTTYGGDSSAVASKLTSGVTQVYSTASAFAAVKSDGSVVTWGNSVTGGDSSAVASQLAGGPSSSVTVGTPNASTGVVTGTVKAIDPAGKSVSYAISTQGAKGTATITSAGAFTYTPTATARHAAARVGAPAADKSDQFTVTATTSQGVKTSVPVTVSIAPQNGAPSVTTLTAGSPAAGTGVVSGKITATDADKDPLSYSANATRGVVAFKSDGSFTYTPQDSARFGAAYRNATAAQKQETFTVTVSDGFGGTASRAVTVNIAPMGAALGALAKIPQGADQIYAEKIQSASDGKYRMVVYMSGVDSPAIDKLVSAVAKTAVKAILARINPLASLVGQAALPITKDEVNAIVTFVTSNIPGIIDNTGFLRQDVQDYINDAYKKFNTPSAPIAEIQLVGHSNGGQQMQAYASAGTYRGNVTSLVVFGSPLIKRTDELGDKSQTGWATKLKALAFRNNNDPVPWISELLRVVGIRSPSNPLGVPGLDVVRWDQNGKAESRFSSATTGLDFKYHDAKAYRDFAAKFDAANTFTVQRQAMQMFTGTVVSTADVKSIFGFSPPVLVLPGL